MTHNDDAGRFFLAVGPEACPPNRDKTTATARWFEHRGRNDECNAGFPRLGYLPVRKRYQQRLQSGPPLRSAVVQRLTIQSSLAKLNGMLIMLAHF